MNIRNFTMNIIGIDPEASGAYSFWNTITGDILLGASATNYHKRYVDLKSNILLNQQHVTYVFIEKAVLFSGAGRISTFESIMKSFGGWLAVLDILQGEELIKDYIIVPAKVWKEVFNLSKDKDESVDLAKGILASIRKEKDVKMDYIQEYLTIKRGELRKKQVEDRAEAFLIGLYGYDYVLG